MALDLDLAKNGAIGAGVSIPGGNYCLLASSSNFNGATATLQILGPDGATWINVGTAAALTANGAVFVSLPSCKVRVVVTGGTPTALYARLSKVDQ